MRGRNLRTVILVGGLALGPFGCGGADDFTVADPSETGLEDTLAEVGHDSAADSGADTARDTAASEVDAASDATDAGDATDGGPEVATDGGLDAPDTTTDAPDSPPDSVPDSLTDSALDGATDSSTDGGVDAPDALPCEAPVACFTDADGDGYAPTGAKSIVACSCPKGTTPKSPSVVVDCNDDDERVHPGATTFYTTPYCVPGTGCATKSYDYDCNGVAEKQFTTKFSGSCGLGCAGEGFDADPPGCGVSAGYTTCRFAVLCGKDASIVTQGCR